MALFDFLNGGMTGSSAPNITPGQLGDQPVGDLMTPGDAHYQPGLLSNLNPQTLGQAGSIMRDQPQSAQPQQPHPQASPFGDLMGQGGTGQHQQILELMQKLMGAG